MCVFMQPLKYTYSKMWNDETFLHAYIYQLRRKKMKGDIEEKFTNFIFMHFWKISFVIKMHITISI